MNDYQPLNIKQETKDRLMQHKQHKRDTQDDVVNHVLDLVEQEAEPTEPVPIKDVVREIPLAQIQEQLDSIESSVNTVETRTNSIDKKVEELR